jgi:hypothetical protein
MCRALRGSVWNVPRAAVAEGRPLEATLACLVEEGRKGRAYLRSLMRDGV